MHRAMASPHEIVENIWKMWKCAWSDIV